MMDRLSPVMQLNPAHGTALRQHFDALDDTDRTLRFGRVVSSLWLERYVDGMDFENDALFGIFADDLTLSGVAHLVQDGPSGEFGVSVLSAHRGLGLGKALFGRAMDYARNRLLKSLFMHCLAENRIMMHIASCHGMQIVRHAGDVDAWLPLPGSTPTSLTNELLACRVALFDYILKSQMAFLRGVSRALTGQGDA